MLMFSNGPELLQLIHNYYGNSSMSQLQFAQEIGVSRTTSSRLCQEAGYRHHTRISSPTPAEFAKKRTATSVLKKVNKP